MTKNFSPLLRELATLNFTPAVQAEWAKECRRLAGDNSITPHHAALTAACRIASMAGVRVVLD